LVCGRSLDARCDDSESRVTTSPRVGTPVLSS
jgi:hypothetical protein